MWRSRGLAHRARISRRALALAVVALVAGLAPGAPGSPTGPAQAATGGCGRDWSSAQQIGTLPGRLLEVSGFVSSSRYPGVAWMIRDSDSPHSLYSFTLGADGPRWIEFAVAGVSNHDWEDVAYTVGADGRGRVWILENGVETGPKEIYEVLEPDPGTGGTVEVANTYRVQYPDGNRNTETLFSLGGRLMVVTKSSPNRVYRLPWPMSPSRTNRLEHAGRLDVDSFLTMAAVSGDERLLATVNTKDDVVAFEDPDGRGDLGAFVGPDPVFRTNMVKSQREAGDFFPYDSCDTVHAFGDALNLGSPTVVGPVAAVDLEPTPSGNGYWVIDGRGRVHAYGDALHLGNLAIGLVPGEGVSSLSGTPSGGGYWMFTSRGRVVAFGDAVGYGDLAATPLNGPVLDSIATASGHGYYMVGADGGIFNFSDRPFLGSLGSTPPARPIVAVAAIGER
jgi:hypothetical protein